MTTNTGSTATATATTSFPVFGLAFVVLLVLKLAGMAGASWGLANLSWWWVFSPLLIGLGIFFTALLLLGLLFGVIFVVGEISGARKRKKARARREAAKEQRLNRFR